MRSRIEKKHLVAVALFTALLLMLAAGCGGGNGGNGGGGEDQKGELIAAGLPEITLVGPATAGAGEVPAFEWEPVDSAARYRLVVLDGKGGILWARMGPETKVNLGGLPGERPAGVSGPVIDAGSSWSVVALDAGNKTIATSVIRPVSP